MSLLNMKPGDKVTLTYEDYMLLKTQCFKDAVDCLTNSLRANFEDGDEAAQKVNDEIVRLFKKSVEEFSQ